MFPLKGLDDATELNMSGYEYGVSAYDVRLSYKIFTVWETKRKVEQINQCQSHRK